VRLNSIVSVEFAKKRIPVATVVGLIAEGQTEQQILDAYPDLETEDIHQALRFAADAVPERVLPPASGQ
jgi:uncharacterized protein (DUF433 family)